MRTSLSALAILAMLSTAAIAAEAEGQIRSIDHDNQTITLDDGKSYKLPGEVDINALSEGMEILIAYDTVGGENLIMDMQLFD
jgi:hypothetical protein